MLTQKPNRGVVIIGSLLLGVGFFISGYYYSALSSQTASQSKDSASTARKVLFWYDPMYPNTKFEKPGKSPFMDMDLVPKYADEDSGNSGKEGIRIDPTQTQNLGLRTEKVQYGQLQYKQTVPAILDFNDHLFAIVQPRADGFVEKVYSFTVGDKVTKGAALIEITVPEWVEAQTEYLLLRKTGAPTVQLKGILEKLRLSGMPEANINTLRNNAKLQTRFTVTAPISGVITGFDLRVGMNFSKDKVIAQIQSINPIWINASIPESMASLVNKDTQLTVSIPAFADQSFKLQKMEILPSANPETKTLRLRAQIDNADERLKPGMNAFIKLQAQGKKALLIPSQSVIDTGDEQRVITVNEEGRFVPKRIAIAAESAGKTALLAGLEEGETVVQTGVFLIDSEANIAGALEKMQPIKYPAEHNETTEQPTDHGGNHD